MSNNKDCAHRLREWGYERKAIAFKLTDRVPENVESYGNAQSFHCAVVAEIWDGRPPLYLTRENILCGGALYSGMGHRRIAKEEFDAGMSQVIGVRKGYVSREALRKASRQILPERKHLNRAFVVLSVASGLDAVIMDPLDSTMVSLIYAGEALMNKDRFCRKYIEAYRHGKLKV